jgi:hypothetical protein
MADMPKEVGPEAHDVALLLDQMMEQLLTEAGLPRTKKTGATIKCLGLLVQWAIDRRMERVSVERMDA